jgi:membrane fusion protein, multidrug efflux system
VFETFDFGARPGRLLILFATISLGVGGCKGTAQPSQAPPPMEVSVIKLAPAPVTVTDEYVALTEAPDTIEIRAQVTGLLDRQAFLDGGRVKKGDVLYVIDQRPYQSVLDQAKANLAQAEANLIYARQNLTRYQRLIKERAISQQDYDTAFTQERANAALVEAQKALVRNAQINLDYTVIRVPRDGFMSSSLVKPGALITAQQTLLDTLYSSDPMWVSFSISQDKLFELQKRLKRPPGDPEKAPPFHVQLPDGTEYNFPGRLNFVDATLDQKTGTLAVRISVPNSERFLRPGLFVRVTVPAFQNPQALRIPQKAVTELQGLKMVYVIGADNKPQSRQISANYRIGNDWVVEKGLSPGELVVVEGLQKVQARPDAPVKPVMVASNATVGGGSPGTASSRAAPVTAPAQAAPGTAPAQTTPSTAGAQQSAPTPKRSPATARQND